MPVRGSMDSYPYQRNQIPSPHCYHPGIEVIPPQIKMDASKSPFPYEQHWPYAGNYGHPIPPHFCCGHNNFPYYYSYRASYPYASAPMYYSGDRPAYSEPFFVPYSPQPHYTMELPKYEYDKYVPQDHHCCGCPNHPCNQKDAKCVKIEEHEPDGGKKVNDALVPIQLKNYPYQMVWIPPEYTNNKQPKIPNAAEVGEQDKISQDKMLPGPENFQTNVQQAKEPRVWNGWLPFDIKGAQNMVHDGDGIRNRNWENVNNRRESEDGRMDQKHQSEHKRSEFPFPIFWLPYYNKQEENGKTNNKEDSSSPKVIGEVPHTFKSVPVKSHVDEGVTNGTRSNQVGSVDASASDVKEKVTNSRSIPVKQVELHQGKLDSKGNHKKEMNVSVNQTEENVTKKDSCTGDRWRQATSLPKASKLPPVCLRVDPLPKKKNGNGSSRSPSPPLSKEHSQAATGETFKISACGTNEKAQPNLNRQNDPDTSEKVIPKEVSEYKTNENNGAATTGETLKTSACGTNDKAQPNLNHQNASDTNEKVKPKEKAIQVSEYKSSENKVADYKDGYQSHRNVNRAREGPKEGAESTEQKEVKDSSKPTDEGLNKGRVLSDTDAAVLIQAAYRGYQVRKWEPLKKLKKINEITKEVTDVRGHVKALESSSDHQIDDKQKMTIGETIMRLLLKLDTLQGVHPSLREIRKSLARELTTLQERLDSSIMAKKPQQQKRDFNVQKPVEVTPMNAQNKEHVQEQQEEKVALPGDSSEGNSDGVKSPHANDGGSASQSPVDPASNEEAEHIVFLNGLDNEDGCQVITQDASNSSINLSETDKMSVEPKAKLEVKDIPIEVKKLDMTAGKELPVGVIDENINDVSTEKDEHNDASSGSLPAMVDDSVCDGLDSENQETTELPVRLLKEVERKDEINFEKEALAENVEYIEELPVGLLDEDIEKPEVEKHDDAETYEEVLPTEEGVCNADDETISSTNDSGKEAELEQPQKEEVQSSAEADGWVKIEFQKEHEVKGEAPMDIEVKCQSGEEDEKDTKLPPLTAQVNDHELGNGDTYMDANNVNKILPEPVEFVPINDIKKEEELQDKVGQCKTQVDGQDLVAEDKDTEISAVKKSELSAASPDLPVTEHDGGLNGDKILLEENEKLRRMMKKLLEAGNEQLSVISDLTGRVKDLEKKLAKSRSKRLKSKRYRSSTFKMSSSK